jgi:hypothetical protein
MKVRQIMTIERSLRMIAGAFVAASVLLGIYVNPLFHWFTLFVGLNLFQSAFSEQRVGVTGVKMDTMLTVLGVLGGWIALQWWVLPRLGVPT